MPKTFQQILEALKKMKPGDAENFQADHNLSETEKDRLLDGANQALAPHAYVILMCKDANVVARCYSGSFE